MPRFFRSLMRNVGRIAPAAIGFGLGGPMGGLIGAGLGMAAGRGGLGGGGGGGGGGPVYQPGPNPAGAAMPYLNRIPQEVRPYYEPYIEGGREASDIQDPLHQAMAASPDAFLKTIMEGYEPSRGYQFKKGEMERAINNNAGHGGFIGTPHNQRQQAELVQGLLSEDMQQFLSNILGTQNTGLEGLERRTNRGFEASTGYGDIVGSTLGSQAGLGYQGQAGQNQMGTDIFTQRLANRTASRNSRMDLLSRILGTGMSFMGGGFGGR